METQIKLTKLASCAGCGAKVGAGVLANDPGKFSQILILHMNCIINFYF